MNANIILFLIVWLASVSAHADDEGHVRFLKYRADYSVNADATYTVLQEVAYRLLTKSALISSGKMPISFNSKLEEAEVVQAYTLKADGRRIDVEPAGIQTQQGQVAAGYGISLADQRTLMITFPQLDVGDTVVYQYRMRQKEPVFPGHFYASGRFARAMAWDEVEVTIAMPDTLALRIETVGLIHREEKRADGRRVYAWQARQLPIVPAEPGAVDTFQSTPHFIASTFTDWEQFAAAYEARAKAKAAVTPAIAALADEITRGQVEPRAQVKAIYDWMAKNIRYVASWAGAEGWVPHDAHAVLSRRYGDCKGHVVLLEALLAAKGIASSTVMINSDKNAYALPGVVYPAFNHVITYVPALNLYLDSTAGLTTPFGVLPVAQADKPVIHTAAQKPLQRTPMLDPTQFTASRITRLTINDDGDATGEFIIRASGAAAIDLRETQQSIGRRKESEWVREFLQGQNLEGEGSIEFSESSDGLTTTMRMTLQIRNYLAISENGVIPLAPIMTGPIAFDHLFGIHKRQARSMPYWCPAWTLEDRYEIRVPRNFKLIVPKSRDIHESMFVYASRYALEDNAFSALRRLSVDSKGMACDAKIYTAMKASVAGIERAIRSQVIYQVQ